MWCGLIASTSATLTDDALRGNTLELVVNDAADQLARIAADIIEDVVRTNEHPVLGLATGSSPLAIYKELIRRHREEGLSFSHCTAFTLDEYVGLPQGHPETYYEVIRNEFTRHIDIDDSRVYSPDGNRDNVATAGDRYEAAIKAAGGVDVQILGIGSNGHIAFNEPGSPLDSRTRLEALTEQTRQDNARFFESIDHVPTHALTQGLGTIMDAKKHVLIATGTAKAEAIKAMLEGDVTEQWPASILKNHSAVTVLADNAATALLAADETPVHSA